MFVTLLASLKIGFGFRVARVFDPSRPWIITPTLSPFAVSPVLGISGCSQTHRLKCSNNGQVRVFRISVLLVNFA